MRKNGDVSPKPTTSDGGVVSRSARTSFRALFRVISSGASTVARSAASAASSAVNRDVESLHDQVKKNKLQIKQLYLCCYPKLYNGFASFVLKAFKRLDLLGCGLFCFLEILVLFF